MILIIRVEVGGRLGPLESADNIRTLVRLAERTDA